MACATREVHRAIVLSAGRMQNGARLLPTGWGQLLGWGALGAGGGNGDKDSCKRRAATSPDVQHNKAAFLAVAAWAIQLVAAGAFALLVSVFFVFGGVLRVGRDF